MAKEVSAPRLTGHKVWTITCNGLHSPDLEFRHVTNPLRSFSFLPSSPPRPHSPKEKPLLTSSARHLSKSTLKITEMARFEASFPFQKPRKLLHPGHTRKSIQSIHTDGSFERDGLSRIESLIDEKKAEVKKQRAIVKSTYTPVLGSQANMCRTAIILTTTTQYPTTLVFTTVILYNHTSFLTMTSPTSTFSSNPTTASSSHSQTKTSKRGNIIESTNVAGGCDNFHVLTPPISVSFVFIRLNIHRRQHL
jgi:hypothetical protein